MDDVARLELLDRLDGRGPALAGALAREVVLTVLQLPTERHVLLEVAEVTGHRLAVALQALLVPLDLAGDADHRAVRLELRERGLEELPGAVPAELADQVDRHVYEGRKEDFSGYVRVPRDPPAPRGRGRAARAPRRGPRRRCRAGRPGR